MSTIPKNNAVQEFNGYLVDNYTSNETIFPHIWVSDTISTIVEISTFVVKGLQMHAMSPSSQSVTYQHIHI